jgi:carboxymethylenebutenolidase
MVAPRTESIDAGGGERFDGTAFLPPGTGPGLLLLQEIWGVGDFVRQKAQALAELGYVVLCPDVFWRVERNVALPHDDAGLAQAFSYAGRFAAIDPAVTAGDLLAALAHLRAMPETDGPAGVLGYCLGGRLAYEVAVAGQPDACVSYYGSGIAERLDLAGQLTCPALFHFGGNDPYIPREEIDRIRAAFAGRDDVEVVVQTEAGHAFENLLAPAFADPVAAARSWPLTVAFLQRTLGAGTPR